MAKTLVGRGLLPARAGTDAMHLAIATVYDLDVLLTWNCRHLANADILLQVDEFLRTIGRRPPLVVTPLGAMWGSGES